MPFQRMSPLRLLPALLVLAACADQPSAVRNDSLITVPVATNPGGPNVIPGRYIVVLKSGSDVPGVAGLVTGGGAGTVRSIYRRALRGFAADLTAEGLARAKNHPDVAFVEPDGVVRLAAIPWNLDRIDQRTATLNNSYAPGATGSGVTVYVLDTGVLTTHVEINGRASAGYDATNDTTAVLPTDCNGHGTHVAGTVAGTTYGVAPGASIVGVKVFPGCSNSTSWSYVIEAVDWVTQNATLPAVVNMSLGGSASGALDSTIRASIESGITYVIAAGNSSEDACASSPARLPEALTVGASDNNDNRASFSNWGPCVDVFAPGVSIVSSWYTSNTQLASSSGTSMAAPHVAGVAALWLQNHSSDTPTEVTAAILDAVSVNRLGEIPNGTTNTLLYTGFAPETGARLALDRSIVEFRAVRAPSGFAPRRGASPDYTGPLVLTNPGNATANWSATSNRGWLSFTPASGTLAPGDSQVITLSAATGFPLGTYEALLRIADAGAVNSPIYATARLHILGGGTLAYDVPATGNWGDVRDPFRYYRLDVAIGTGSITVQTSGGSGDMDLYLDHAALPSEVDFTCRSVNGGNLESCVINSPAPGEWWILLHAYSSYTGASVTASRTAAPPPGKPATFTATLAGPTSIALSWSDTTSNESRWTIQWRQRTIGGTFPSTWTSISPSPGANVTSYVHTGRTPNREYQYRIKACHTFSCSTSYKNSNIVATP